MRSPPWGINQLLPRCRLAVPFKKGREKRKKKKGEKRSATWPGHYRLAQGHKMPLGNWVKLGWLKQIVKELHLHLLRQKVNPSYWIWRFCLDRKNAFPPISVTLLMYEAKDKKSSLSAGFEWCSSLFFTFSFGWTNPCCTARQQRKALSQKSLPHCHCKCISQEMNSCYLPITWRHRSADGRAFYIGGGFLSHQWLVTSNPAASSDSFLSFLFAHRGRWVCFRKGRLLSAMSPFGPTRPWPSSPAAAGVRE